jgi:predicted regulator of Ras-like GTPase activity (Roadblock/LC7/MglB family)
MFRMKFRANMIGIGALILGAGLIGSMQMNPIFAGREFQHDLPLLYIAPAQFAVPLLFALVHYRACPPVQQLSAFLTTLAYICGLGIIGNLTANKLTIIQQDWLIHFNVVQIACMNIAAIIGAMKTMHIEQMSSFADTKVAEAQLGRLKAVKVDPETQAKWEKAASHADRASEGRSLRNTMTNLKAISLSDPSEELKPQPRSVAPEPKMSDPGADAGSLASLLDRIGDEPAPVFGEEEYSPEPVAFEESAPSPLIDEEVEMEAPRPAELDKEIVRDDFVPKAVEAPSDSFLSKFLDREDQEEEEAVTKEQEPAAETFAPAEPAIKFPDSAEINTQPEPVEKPSQPSGNFKLTSQSTKSEAISPEAKVETKIEPKIEPPAPPVEPVVAKEPTPPSPADPEIPTATANRLQAMKRRNTSTFTKLQSLSASDQLRPATPEVVQESEPDSLKSLLDRLDEGTTEAKVEAPVEEVKEPLEAPFELTIDFIFKAEEAAKAAPVAEKKVEAEPAARSSVSERLTEHKEEVIVEAIDESDPIASLDLSAKLNDLDSEPEETATPEEQVAAPQEEAEEVEEEEEGGALFEGGVDSDIDNIFSNLAPPEAQMEVKDSPIAAKAEPASASIVDNQAGEEEDDDEEDKGVLFGDGVDQDIDNIFSNLAPPEAQKEVKDVLPAAKSETKAAPAPVAEPEEEEEEEKSEGLFGENLGEELDTIFSNLTSEEQKEVTNETLNKVKKAGDQDEKAEEKAPVKEEVKVEEKPAVKEAAKQAPEETKTEGEAAKPEAAKYKEVKEFGRLSGRSANQPKTQSESVGTMKTIGKLLLDVQAVENIIKAGETKKIGSGLSTAKVISAARGEGIKNILTAIDTYEGVTGSLIVGHDGLVIASTVGQGWDKDMLGALSTALLSTSNLATKKLEIGKLRQMVLLTELAPDSYKSTVLTDVDVGILAVFMDRIDLTKIDGLLETIHKTIHGG